MPDFAGCTYLPAASGLLSLPAPWCHGLNLDFSIAQTRLGVCPQVPHGRNTLIHSSLRLNLGFDFGVVQKDRDRVSPATARLR
jgi:hypothetical protein